MCCDDYPGAVVLTAPSNNLLKLMARVDWGMNLLQRAAA